ncbi:MAG: acetyl-CoA carboxylase carboxyltransferase subunit alpha [Planctomycetes bacterium]|nr:acetyl-CoA carboxylase carboxyltransferase subunit alpha [Planctomycetota bacterium]
MAKKNKKQNASLSALPFEKPIEDVRSRLLELQELSERTSHDLKEEIDFYQDRLQRLTTEIYADLSSWERVQVARHPARPLSTNYIEDICEDWVELHGDGLFGDDRAMATGLATIRGHKVMLVAQRKGQNTKDRLACNFGSAHPEGYRKALRKMKLAARMGLPIVCLINTPGAYPGVGAEERGQARAIAENIYEMFSIETPIISIVIGEGGSGGALGIAIADKVAILENSWYSVISPEGCASILWRSADGKEDAAEALKLTAPSLLKLGIVDDVIGEPVGGAHNDPSSAMNTVADYIDQCLIDLKALGKQELLQRRDDKFRNITRQRQVAESNLESDAQANVDAPRKSVKNTDFMPTNDDSSRN